MKNILIITLQIIIGVMFIFSGVSKLFPIEYFEFLLVTQGILDWNLAPYFSRSLIAFEIFLGLAFLQKKMLREIFIPVSLLILLVFNLHLIFTLFTTGNTGSCGCFGQLIPMTQTEALIKNILTMAILIFLFTVAKKETDKKYLLPLLLLLVVIGLTFILKPVKEYKTASESLPNVHNIETDVDTLSKQEEKSKANTAKILVDPNKEFQKKYPPVNSIFSDFKEFINPQNSEIKKVNLNRGEKLIAILSLDCDHCIEVTKKFGISNWKEKNQQLFILFLGEENQVELFFQQAGAKFPYKILDAQTFFPLIQTSPPRVVYLVNGNILGDWDGETFSIETVLKKLESVR